MKSGWKWENFVTYITLRQRPELKEQAATWFHDKWKVPQEAYEIYTMGDNYD